MNRVVAILTLSVPVLVLPFAEAKSSAVASHVREQVYQQGGDGWSIYVRYPRIEALDHFNATVLRQVHTAAAKFRKELPSTPSEESRTYDSYLNGICMARVLKNDIISVLCDYGEYMAGAAHPWEIVASVNYDTRTDRVLTLSDVFNSGSDYVSRLSEVSIELLSQRTELPDEEIIRNGAGPVERNFQVFTLTDEALVVHFQQYQVGPGAVPALEVEIPFPRLRPLLRTRYVQHSQQGPG